MATQRISNEPAYVLHRYDWSESSLILDVFTRHYGRVALVARGAKKPSSSFRPILLPLLDAETATLARLAPQQRYVLVAEAGLRLAHDDDRISLPGEQWQALQQALGEKSLFSDTLRACVPGANELKFQLRSLLHYHCGVRVLKTRQMMMDLQAL